MQRVCLSDTSGLALREPHEYQGEAWQGVVRSTSMLARDLLAVGRIALWRPRTTTSASARRSRSKAPRKTVARVLSFLIRAVRHDGQLADAFVRDNGRSVTTRCWSSGHTSVEWSCRSPNPAGQSKSRSPRAATAHSSTGAGMRAGCFASPIGPLRSWPTSRKLALSLHHTPDGRHFRSTMRVSSDILRYGRPSNA